MKSADGTVITVAALPITAVWAAYFALDMRIEYSAFLVALLCAVCGSLLIPFPSRIRESETARTGVILVSIAGIIAGITAACASAQADEVLPGEDVLFEIEWPLLVLGGLALSSGIAFVGASTVSFIDGAHTRQSQGSFLIFMLAFGALAAGISIAVAGVAVASFSPLTLSYAPAAVLVIFLRRIIGIFKPRKKEL